VDPVNQGSGIGDQGSGIGDQGSGIDHVELARKLIDIESTTGQEGRVAAVLAQYLRERGDSVLEQPLDNGRTNVIAAVGEPEVVFSTHFDCVPPFFPSRIEGGLLYGRGACDAKGILATQIAAAERLRAAGETRIGLLFVAGEERGSDGARAANRIASNARYLINGEPTDLRLGAATRGCFRVRLTASGRAAHSGYPELGESAIEKLLDCLMALRAAEWPSDPLLGTTHYTVGLINGGVAPNVVPPGAEAEVFFRTVGDHAAVRATLAAALANRVTVDEILELPAVRLHTVPGFETAVFSYFSDVPFLSNWGTPLLLGPGSIHVAHTDREHVAIAELDEAVGVYARLATALLAAAAPAEAGRHS
jgi:acetylornithine deacetylase